MEGDYTFDVNGDRIYVGDYVKCVVDWYASINRGENRRIQRIENGCIILINGKSPNGTSPYRPDRFALQARHHPWHRQKKGTNMLHMAIRVNPQMSYDEIATTIREREGAEMSRMIIAAVTQPELKERIKARLSQYPEEKWLCLSGNTIAEIEQPRVSYRQY